ncbi:MAG: hypothetical protein JGK17_20950 [Microcoleus sp. PH2017_10_PVI_O_A]|uniref:hypothetical protein n=1 Tax=unclassified Microcoleus TaxID=2642155 RepID=UPI001D8F22C8|nr:MULTISPECIES: hypothetical protein [unclassified Microcoleus]MCC3408009.1 hypothetical protein [Microcoleus sp. PH2017_10_PVI_O_A]MCC3460117.1 hypothetical protein [Microcoleus sp. PH2017_11_PCY_U_A]MCC3480151.1 hypothetical protein [Microcoleus sp. PH2017_12_PCY_D_A]MCC3528000.1 hypothetical protein [Microcoleus sp. PH2017_21_RUC_O_A]MCC3540030.1 hypothetical protein [Microcoleus sp. PH2017_22_RUC_O_B]
MFSYTKLIECHNLQSQKIVDFCVNYTYLIASCPPSGVGKYSDSTAAAAVGRSGKIRIFWRQQRTPAGDRHLQATLNSKQKPERSSDAPQ